MKVAVTGANGFVGQHTLRRLREREHLPLALVRDGASFNDAAVDHIIIPTLNGSVPTDELVSAIKGCDVVIHLAAQVHDMSGTTPESVMRDINIDGSSRLMEAAIAAGSKRFIFISSVKAVGEQTDRQPFNSETIPAPLDPYGRSKLDGERTLSRLAANSGIELVILRPTFVYGWPLVGNFKLLVNTVRAGRLLPFKTVDNSRDMVYVGNLADAICIACTANNLTASPYFIADGEPVSTPELIRRVGAAFETPAKLMHCPMAPLKLAGILTRKSAAIQRLTENLEVDISTFCRDAAWKPPYKMTEGLAMCARSARDAEPDGQRLKT